MNSPGKLYDYYLMHLRGKNIKPDIEMAIAKRSCRNWRNVGLPSRLANQNKMSLGDYLVHANTNKLKNTKIARLVYKDKLIRYYKGDEVWIRVLK